MSHKQRYYIMAFSTLSSCIQIFFGNFCLLCTFLNLHTIYCCRVLYYVPFVPKVLTDDLTLSLVCGMLQSSSNGCGSWVHRAGEMNNSTNKQQMDSIPG